MQREKCKVHRHKGKSSESLINKEAVLNALNIQPGQVILDAGCGNGYMTKEFLKLLNGQGKVYALDPDKESIEILKQEIDDSNCDAFEGKITAETPLEEASLDLIYLSTVVHGFSKEDFDNFHKEIKRLLKKGGQLAILEINKENTPFGPPAEMRFSPNELKNKIDLTPEVLIEAGEHFYMQIFKKN